MTGESPVTQVVTQWRLNVSIITISWIILQSSATLTRLIQYLWAFHLCNIAKHLILLKVAIASGASLSLFILAFFLVRMPPQFTYPSPSIHGVSVLETLWIGVHSWTIHEHMADIEELSLDNLRKAGMFTICLGDIHASQVLAPESEAFLEWCVHM